VIDIWGVVFNSLWIFGLAILLAIWSFGRYAAHKSGVRTRDKLREPRYAIGIDVGLLLFIAGMVATEERLWGRLLWGALGIAVLVDGIRYLTRGQSRDAGA